MKNIIGTGLLCLTVLSNTVFAQDQVTEQQKVKLTIEKRLQQNIQNVSASTQAINIELLIAELSDAKQFSDIETKEKVLPSKSTKMLSE